MYCAYPIAVSAACLDEFFQQRALSLSLSLGCCNFRCLDRCARLIIRSPSIDLLDLEWVVSLFKDHTIHRHEARLLAAQCIANSSPFHADLELLRRKRIINLFMEACSSSSAAGDIRINCLRGLRTVSSVRAVAVYMFKHCGVHAWLQSLCLPDILAQDLGPKQPLTVKEVRTQHILDCDICFQIS